jgi:hypothetical protein
MDLVVFNRYVTAMSLFYLRLTGNQEEIYKTLEPFYEDFRKLVFRKSDGTFIMTHMDEFVSELLTKDSVCDTILPRISKRQVINFGIGFGGTGSVGPQSQSTRGGFIEGVDGRRVDGGRRALAGNTDGRIREEPGKGRGQGLEKG